MRAPPGAMSLLLIGLSSFSNCNSFSVFPRQHCSVNACKYVARASYMQDLVALGFLFQQAAESMAAAVASALNVLIAGATQVGIPANAPIKPVVCHAHWSHLVRRSSPSH